MKIPWRTLGGPVGGHLEVTWRLLGDHLESTWSPSRPNRRPEALESGQLEPKRRSRDSKLSPGRGQARPSAPPKRACKLEVQLKSFQVAKTRKSSSRAGESSTLRVAGTPKNRSQRRQVALKVRLGGPSCAQEAPSCAWSAAWSAQGRQERRKVALGVRFETPS